MEPKEGFLSGVFFLDRPEISMMVSTIPIQTPVQYELFFRPVAFIALEQKGLF